jgi:thiol-disulfide isomerase/thioredoxin
LLVVHSGSYNRCGPCRRIGPKYAAFSNTYTQAVFLHIDVDQLGVCSCAVSDCLLVLLVVVPVVVLVVVVLLLLLVVVVPCACSCCWSCY